jgi:gentisate 1,2-dioxygenase
MTDKREAFYSDIDPDNLTALWTVMGSLITREPKSGCRAHLWHYDDIRPHLMRAGELISAKEAERRVLILENPGLRGHSKITTSLYAGLQLVLPGEVAPAHRHSQTALRFVLEGAGAHTAVNGERTYMQPGDFVITPQWAWHDHGNTSDEPMVWLDGLDIPLVQFLDASFAEPLGADEQAVTRPAGSSPARYGQGLLPVDYEAKDKSSPIFNYPYERSRAALETLKQENEWDQCHGLKMRYVNPVDGDYAMPTMGTFLQLLPKGFSTARFRSTDATVFVCVEGKGASSIGEQTFHWGPRDIFVVPSWQPVAHEAEDDSVLFSYSDRPVQEKLGLYRENRGNA